MNDIEKVGGSLDHLNETGLKSLVRNLEQEVYFLQTRLSAVEKQYEFDVKRPRQLRAVIERLADGNYLRHRVIDVRHTPDGEEVVISRGS